MQMDFPTQTHPPEINTTASMYVCNQIKDKKVSNRKIYTAYNRKKIF
jgi:hypothetical protein